MKTTNFSFLFLLALVISACSGLGSTQNTPTEELTAEQIEACNDLVAQQQFQPVAIAFCVVNDISSSYRHNPETINYDILYKAMVSCQGRVVFGYTHIDEDSYQPIIRLNHLARLVLETPKNNEITTNPWIKSEETSANSVYQAQVAKANAIVDSINNASLILFKGNVADKLNRGTAKRSDVVFALKRAQTFLNEFPNSQRVIIVCSDFQDTYGRTMTLDKSITLYIIGSNVNASDVKKSTGLSESSYRLFEAPEEAFNIIANQYMYNSKKQ